MSLMVELARTRTKLIHRMPDAGDLWVFVDAGVMYLRADQVEAIAGIPPWSTGELLVDVDTWETIDGHACYPVEAAIARCEAAATPAASRFLTWLQDVLTSTDDGALDNAQMVPSFIGSHPVDGAARILSADPEITIGRNGLFAFMHEAGWLDRAGSDWTITHAARRNGWLTVRNVSVRGRGGVPYPQPYVTPAGLIELQKRLTVGRRHSPPEPTQPQTLFD